MAPLFVTQIDPIAFDASTVVTDEAGVFAHAGDELAFDLTIENRVPVHCEGVYDEESSDELRLAVSYLPETGTSIDAAPVTLDCKATAVESSIQPGEVCENAEVKLPSPAHTPAGEQRVRFVAFDADADDDGDGVPDDCLDDDRREDLLSDDLEGACTGAERVIVVDRRPDVAFDSLSWVEPASEERHTTNVHVDSVFELSIENAGKYPTWNPNGNRGIDTFWARSSYDQPGDGDLEPDERRDDEQAYDAREDRGPVCNWVANDEEGLQAVEYPCSYRRGARLDPGIQHELHRNGPDGPVVESDDHKLYLGQEYPTVDKPDAIAHDDNEAGADNTETRLIEAVDRFRRAGEFSLSTTIDTGSQDDVPEPAGAEDDNVGHRTIDLAGSDLEIQDPRVSIQTPDGVRASCTDANPCPLDSTIQVDPAFANLGDDEATYADTERVLDRTWIGAVYLDGQVARTSDGGHANTTFEQVPETTEGAQALFGDEATDAYDGVEIEPTAPGVHELEIRLDHPDNYEAFAVPPESETGFVGERSEDHECASTAHAADNAYCQSLVFVDEGPIEILDVGVELADTGQPLATIEAGEEVCFTASVDGAPTNVDVTFEHADGTPAYLDRTDAPDTASLQLEPADGGPGAYEACERVDGPIGDLVYQARAVGSEDTVVSDDASVEIVRDLANPNVADVTVEKRSLPRAEGNPANQKVQTTIANDGAETGPVDVTVYACPEESPVGVSSPLFGCEELLSTVAGSLADDERRDYEVAWDTLEKSGEWRVCTEIAPADDLRQDTASDDERCRNVFVYV